MKWIDGTLGRVLVLLASLWQHVSDRLEWPKGHAFETRGHAGHQNARPRSILVIKFFGLGSIQLSTPCLAALREQWPTASIQFLTFAQNAPLVRLLTPVDDVWTVRTDNLFHFGVDTIAVVKRLHANRPDLVLDLEFFSRYSTLLAWLSKAPVRVGYAGASLRGGLLRTMEAPWRQALLTHTTRLPLDVHCVDSYLQMLDTLSIKGRSTLLAPKPGPAARAHVTQLLEGCPEGGPLTVVNVNAGEKSLLRRWPPERFVELADGLASHGVAIAFVGASDEQGYVTEIWKQLDEATRRRAFHLAGGLTIEQLVALTERADLFVSNDSGPLHVAAAIGRPTISFFGPETPERFGPRGPQHVIFYQQYPCSPCVAPDSVSPPCPHDQRCLKAIPVHAVLAAALRLLQRERPYFPFEETGTWAG